MVFALPLALALLIIMPIMLMLIFNDLGKVLKKRLDRLPNGRKEDEDIIIKCIIIFITIFLAINIITGM